MSSPQTIRSKLSATFAGDWGSDPVGENGTLVIRSTNFGKESRLDLTKVVRRQIEPMVLERKRLKYGDTLLEKSGGGPDQPVGRVVFVDDIGEATCSNFIQACRPKPDNDPRYFCYFLDQLYRAGLTLRFQQQTTGLMNLKLTEFLETEVHFPSRLEQTAIARVLAAIDLAMKQTEALLAKHERIKAGLMHDLLTRGLDAGGRLRTHAAQALKDSSFGPIPHDWDDVLLDSVAHRGSGHTPSKSHPEYWNGGIKWVSLADSDRLDRVFISRTVHEISAQGIKNSSAVELPPGVVILSRDAGIGKSAITTDTMAVSQHFMAWRCGPQLNNFFLYYWLQSRKPELENIAIGSTIKTIGLRFFREMRVPRPPIEEQVRIGQILFASDQLKFSAEKRLAKLRRLKAGMMQDLLGARVSVAPLLFAVAHA